MVETLTRPETPGRPTPTGTKPWLRPFWRITSALGAVALLVTGTIQVAGLLGHEEETIVTTVPAEGLTTLVVDNQAGPVRVVGVSETDEVRVTARGSTATASSSTPPARSSRRSSAGSATRSRSPGTWTSRSTPTAGCGPATSPATSR